jgi:hypothetical protein
MSLSRHSGIWSSLLVLLSISLLLSLGSCQKKVVETGQVTVTCSTIRNAEVRVDGSFVGDAPITLTLPAGLHNIDVTAPRATTYHREINVMANQHVNVIAEI